MTELDSKVHVMEVMVLVLGVRRFLPTPFLGKTSPCHGWSPTVFLLRLRGGRLFKSSLPAYTPFFLP